MKKMKHSIYSGVLAKPIVLQRTEPLGLLNDPSAEDVKNDREVNNSQIRERIQALFDHYEIDRTGVNAEIQLVWALASDHVAGCKLHYQNANVGRPGKWTPEASMQLLADVWAQQAENKKTSARKACNDLISTPKFEKRYKGQELNSLYRRYSHAIKKLNPLIVWDDPRKDQAIIQYAIDSDARSKALVRSPNLLKT